MGKNNKTESERSDPTNVHAGDSTASIERRSPIKGVSLRSIFINLKMPSFGLFLFLIGLNGMYFLPLVFPKTLYEGAQAGTYRFYYLSWLLICVGGAWETWRGGFELIRRKPLWVFILISAVTWLDIRSIVDGEPLINVIYKSLPFYWLLLVPAVGLKARNWPWLWLTFLFHLPIGVIYSLNAFLVRGATTRWTYIQLEGQNFLDLSIYMGLFMFMMLPAVRGRFLKGAAIFMFGMSLLQAFFSSSRLLWYIIPIQLFMLIYIFTRTRGVKVFVQRLMMGMMLVVTVAGLLFIGLKDSEMLQTVTSRFGTSYAALMDRLLQYGSVVDTVLENERFYEIRTIVSRMEWSDWIFGKGLADRWSDIGFLYGQERQMSHNTWLNSFYWGGVLLFLTITIPLFWIIRTFLRSRDATALCYAAYLLLFNITFPAFLRTINSFDWLMMCLVLGACVWYEPMPKKKVRQAAARQNFNGVKYPQVASSSQRVGIK